MAHVDRREYWIIFGALTALTALEVGIVYMPMAVGLLVSALIGLAVVKAALVGLFFMHLKHETPVLKATVLVPMLIPVLYAAVLVAEGAWRLLP